MECCICKKQLNNIRALSSHLAIYHNLSYYNYLVEFYPDFIPKCPFCGDYAKHKHGNLFRKTCGRNNCKSKESASRRHSEETKELLSKKRLEYIKNNPECTAWRKKNLSGPEKIFKDALERNNGNQEFDITREKSIYPFFIDFAFENVKVAVEIDGSQHKREDKKEVDERKENKIKEKGGRIFRVSAGDVIRDINDVLNELKLFIGSDYEKKSVKKIEKEREKLKREKGEKKLKEKEELAELVIYRRELLENSDIDLTKPGGVGKVSELWNVSHTQVRRGIDRFYPDLEFYRRKSPQI